MEVIYERPDIPLVEDDGRYLIVDGRKIRYCDICSVDYSRPMEAIIALLGNEFVQVSLDHPAYLDLVRLKHSVIK